MAPPRPTTSRWEWGSAWHPKSGCSSSPMRFAVSIRRSSTPGPTSSSRIPLAERRCACGNLDVPAARPRSTAAPPSWRARRLARARACSWPARWGPTGMLMEPLGGLTAPATADAYAEQAAALSGAGVDLLLLETFFALDEALAAIEGIRRASALPLVVSFSFDQGTRTMMGLSPMTMMEAISPLGVAAIGANCGRSLADMERVVAELAGLNTGIPLWINPNAGLPRMVGDVARYDTGPDEMAEYATRFIEAGARVIGGCCGTSPEHTRCMIAAASGGRLRVRGQD